MLQFFVKVVITLTIAFAILCTSCAKAQPLFGIAEDPADRAIWSSPGRLTLSFAQDGTDIAGHDSELFSAFEHLLTDQEIEDTLIRAFQQWAQLSSINVGLVDDDPEIPFGTSGPTQTDFLVGDIRVGAVPMAGDVFAVAVPQNELLSGGWSGTILFNSLAQFDSAEQFFAVALHEAGHVLGLEHSLNRDSVMHPTALNVKFTAQDIEEIQALYGSRILDPHDIGGHSNDNIANATEIRNNGSIDGVVPTIAFGDISGESDIDYFVAEVNSGYSDSITFRLINREISVADLRMTVTDNTGLEYAVKTATGSRGAELIVVIPQTDDDLEYFVRIETAPDSRYATGTYALVTTFDANLDDGAQKYVRRIIRRNYNFVEQDQIQELFCQDEPFCGGLLDLGLNEEIGGPANDSFETATILEPLIEFDNADRFRIQTSLQTDFVDIDFFRLTAPDDCNQLVVKLTALNIGGPISDVMLFDAQRNELDGQVFVNGNGELLIRYNGIKPSADYVVRIAANDPDVFATGNYQMDVFFCSPDVATRNLANGILRLPNRFSKHSLYVARSQLFHFSLNSETQESSKPPSNSTIWMSILTEDGQLVYRVAAKLNEIRTSRSVILRPGSYAIRVNLTYPSTIEPRQPSQKLNVEYSIRGAGVSEPTGPEIIDAADDPFAPCDKLSNEFCYPNDVMSLDPFIVVGDDGFEPMDPASPPAWEDANIWYWIADWLG